MIRFREGCDATAWEADEAIDASGEDTFGPVEDSPDGGNTWLTLQGTTDTNRVVGTGLPGVEGL